jgi:hypothetical protein
MSDEAAPERISVLWSPEAQADLRAIVRETAMQILYCIDRYLASRVGDVKKLKPPLTGFVSAAATTVFSSIKGAKAPSGSPASATAVRLTAEA